MWKTRIKAFINRLSTLCAHLLIFIITGLRPLLGPATCRYPLGCTAYTIEQLQNKNVVVAVWLSIKRIASCNPFNMIK